jgi:ribosomal protein S18 acetylase RimI-like enzyme
MNQQPGVRRLDTADVEAAAGVLVRAFFDSPFWTWLEPDASKRRALMQWYIPVGVRHGLLAGEVFGLGHRLHAIAIWDPPEDAPTDRDPGGARSGYADHAKHMSAVAIARSEAASETQRTVRVRVMEGRPFWYLSLLGVDPVAQRRGAGTALLRDMFARADASGVPICTDTAEEANVPYYAQHGFRLVHHGELPLGGPNFWTFRHDPV